MRIWIPLIVLVHALGASTAMGQWDASVAPKDESSEQAPSSPVVIDAPPAPSHMLTPPSGVVLQQPGQVLVSGTPVRVQLRSPTNGVSFQLRMGGSYSSISGVSMGLGYGYGWGGWGYPGWGWGYPGWGAVGVAPYYGEVVTKTYQPICEAPCDATLLSGRYRMALSLGGGHPVDVAQPVELTSDSVIEGRYVDKRRLRRAGWATFAAGAIAGMALMFASVDYRYDPYYGEQIRYPAMFYTGVGVLVSSIIAGGVLAAQNDEAHVNVYPAR
ncbi:MAG: hypothetical protein WAU39_06630 [Polyangiales bacterium]